MKIGTIIKNPWCSSKNPLEIGYYMGTKGKYFTTLCVYDGKFHYSNYDKNSLQDFKVLGASDIINKIKIELDSFKEVGR